MSKHHMEIMTEDGINVENEHGHLLEEVGGGMPADLTLELDSRRKFYSILV